MKKMIMVLFSAATLAVLNCFADDTYWATGELNVSKTRGETISLQFDIPKSYTHIKTATLTINAWDVDTQDGKERDEVYLNGTHLGKLYGGTDCWDLNQFSVPVSAINSGVNQLHIVADADNNGWWTKIEYAKLVVDGVVDYIKLKATTNLDHVVKLNWDSSSGLSAAKYYVYRSRSQHGPFELIAERLFARHYRDETCFAGVNYYYYVASQSGIQSDVVIGKKLVKVIDPKLKFVLTGFDYPLEIGAIGLSKETDVLVAGHAFRFKMTMTDYQPDCTIKSIKLIGVPAGGAYGQKRHEIFCSVDSEEKSKYKNFVKGRVVVANSNAFEFDAVLKSGEGYHGKFNWTADCEYELNGKIGNKSLTGTEKNVYFELLGTDNGNSAHSDYCKIVPNWFAYWGKDGACPGLRNNSVVYRGKFDPAGRYSYGGEANSGAWFDFLREVRLDRDVINCWRPIKIQNPNWSDAENTFFTWENGVRRVYGIYKVEDTLAHEWQHHETAKRYNAQIKAGKTDSDKQSKYCAVNTGMYAICDDYTKDNRREICDGIVDDDETGNYFIKGLNPDNPDTYGLGYDKGWSYGGYGDNELVSMVAGRNGMHNANPYRDWAYPGEQSGGIPIQASPSYRGTKALMRSSAISLQSSQTQENTDTNLVVSINGISVERHMLDGCITGLVYTIAATIQGNDAVEFNGSLIDSKSNVVANAVGVGTSETDVIDLFFDAKDIFNNSDGDTYTLGRVVLMVDDNFSTNNVIGVLHDFAVEPIEVDKNELLCYKAYILSTASCDVSEGGVDVSIPILVNVTNNYSLTAELVNTNGDLVATATASNTCAVGTNTFVLAFSNDSIFQSGVDGFDAVRNLKLWLGDELIDADAGPYELPTSYRHTDFVPSNSYVTVDLTSESFLEPDVTADGKLSSLKFYFDVTNGTDDTISYDVSAVLFGTNTEMVTSISSKINVTNGVNHVELVIPASSIAVSNVDGPYWFRSVELQPQDENACGATFWPKSQSGVYKASDFGNATFEVGGTPEISALVDYDRLSLEYSYEATRTGEIVVEAVMVDKNGDFAARVISTNNVTEIGTKTNTITITCRDITGEDAGAPYAVANISLRAGVDGEMPIYANTEGLTNIYWRTARCFVDANAGSDLNDGRSWDQAYKTISYAIPFANSNNTIAVKSGLYSGFTTGNSAITIAAVDGPNATIIDGGGETRCANLGSNTAQTNTVLIGFTLRNGLYSMGAGAYGGTLKNCVIENCRATQRGGGACYSVLEDCQLRGNTAAQYGGGAYMSLLHRCLVSGNKATGSYGGGIEESTAYDCVIQGNSAATMGGGAYYSELYNCTVIGNNAARYGGGVYDGMVVNSIIWNNTATLSNNYYRTQGVYNCTTPLLPGDGNIESDPLLRGAEFGGFMLSAGSPCVDAGLDDEYTTADYVRAGLVGHWDGIDNAGMGTHDPTTRVWTDLTGQTGDGDLAASVVWCDGECWSNSVSGKPVVLRGKAFADTVSSNIFTLEFIVRPSRSNVRQSYLGSWETGKFGVEQNSGNYTDGSTRLYFNAAPDFKADNAKIAAGELAMISVVATASACYVYKNGVLVNTYNGSRAAPTAGVTFVIGGENTRDAMAFCGKYYAMRLYNRALSTSEVAANYAVDKKRYRNSSAGIATASQRDFIGNARIQGSHVDMGAVEGVTNACFVMTRTVGGGSVDVSFELVEPHSSLTITADESARPFDRFETYDGRVFTNSPIILSDITSEVFLTAYFKYYEFYVNAQNGDDANDGLSWASAKRTIQAAIDCAVDSEKIWVAKGVYEPIVTNDKTIEIEAVEGALLTSIDGGGTNRCATLATSGSMASKTNTVLVGFTLTNGRAAQGAGAYGGTLKNCIIKSNMADGATYCYGGGTYYGEQYGCRYERNSVSATGYGYGGAAYYGTSYNCSYVNNSVYGVTNAYGGGVYYGAHYDCGLTNNTSSSNGGAAYGGTWYRASVSKNKANLGGGFYYGTVYDATIIGNRATGDGGGANRTTLTDCMVANNQAGGSGGGALLTDYSATRTVFKNNIARGSGGGVYGGTCTDCGITNNTATSNGGGAYNITATRTSFVGNKAVTGGGIYSGTYNSCTVEGNTATGEGGGAYSGTFYDSLISGNEASGVGGGLRGSTFHRSRIIGNRSNGDGGGVYNGNGYNSLILKNKGLGNGGGTYSGYNYNCTITENWCGGSGGGTCNGTHYNTIIVDNADPDGEFNRYSGTIYNCFAANDGVPRFVNPGEGDYRLRVGSPCINAGNNSYANGSTDLALATRIQGGTVDMGCYEGGVDGLVVSVNSIGVGSLEYDPSVVTNGGSFTISASSTGRAFLYFKTNDVVATAAPTLTLDGITGDVKVTAEFVHEMFVDVANGADDNNGHSWVTAKKSIQAAIDASVDGDTIWVADGVYGPIDTKDKPIDIVSVNGAEKTIIDGGGVSCCAWLGADYRFSNSSRLTGFTLRNGFNDYGGGARYGRVDNCVIENCRVTINGGGVDYSNISNCIIRNNSAQKSGGGFTGGTWRRAVNCKFIGNTAREHGGGVTDGALCRNCEFVNNIAGGNGGGMNGGTAYDSTFAGNHAVTGGATYNGTFYRCTLSGNISTGDGGGGYAGTFYDSVISNNTASGVGGGLRGSTFHRSHVVCNKASGDGGGVYGGTGYNSIIVKNKTNGNGGGTCEGSTYNCTITENWCVSKGGGTCNGAHYNTIIVDNADPAGEFNRHSGSVYNCFAANDGDPRFVNPGEGDYRLRSGSPCLNAGNASYVNGSLDVARRTRVQDGTVDIGAHEGSVEGFVVDVVLQGGATISHSSVVVGSNGTFTVYAVNSVRPLTGILTNGVLVSSTVPVTLTGITSDVELTVDCAHDLYVDADVGDDGNNGLSRDAAKQSIQAAINVSLSGDVIHVADGYYAPFSSGNRNILIKSDNGPDFCVVDGGYSARCATLGGSPSEAQTTIEGLTLCNGYSSAGGGCYYGKAVDCIIEDCYSTGDGGGAYGTYLRDCVVVGNVASANGGGSYGGKVRAWSCVFADNISYGSGGGAFNGAYIECVFEGNRANSNGGAAYDCLVQRSILRDNQAATGGGTYNGTMYSCLYYDNYASSYAGAAYYGTLYNCTLTRNKAAGTTGGMYYSTAYNTICRNNKLNSGAIHDFYGSSYYNCCLSSSSGSNTIVADPLFYDAANDDFRLSMNSPCVNKGDNSRVSDATDLRGQARIQEGTVDIGCYEGPVYIWQITVVACGHGIVLDNGTSTLDGGDLSFVALEDGVPFLGFYTNGVFATAEKEFTWCGISGHGTLEAWFKQDIYVDASMSDDSGDGLTWETARKDLAAVVAEASNGANIWVKRGTYAPIISQNKKLVIRAVDGNENTIISGDGVEQCANLIEGNGSVSTQTNTVLIGFALRDGFAANGGGAMGGTLHDCVILSNLATNYGGGTYYGVQHGCVYRGNIVSNNAAYARGGAAYYGTSYKCTYMENLATGATNTYGGAIYGGVHYDCIVTSNKSSRFGGGICSGTYYRNAITDNDAYFGGGCGSATIVYDSLISRNSARTGGGGYNSRFYGCTVVDNVATNYGGAYFGAATNSIIYGNSVMDGTYTNWYSVAMQYSCSDPLANGAGNICADPLFVDPANGNYRLTEGSPCLNAGYNIYVHSMQKDVDSHNRILDGVVDMGCYEGVFSIVAETQNTPAPVPHVWLDSYPEMLAAFGGDYEAMASAPSPGASGGGKVWPNGSPCYMWQDFVAGTSPTNDIVFTATIRMEGNTPVVTWEPDTPELRATRVYKTLGKKTLMDKDWVDITNKNQSEYHFFRVTVDLP